MHVRRTLAAVIAASALALTGCAGDDLSNDTPKDAGSEATGSGPVRISGQAFPEAKLVAEMYSQLLEAKGFEPEVKLVDTRDAYMSTFPGSIDVVPEYVGGIVDFLNVQANGAKAKSLTTTDAEETADAGKSLLEDKGITLLDTSVATDTNAFFVTKEFSQAENVTMLSELKGMSVVLAAAPDCEGRTDCAAGLTDTYGIKITKVLPLGFASDQTYQSVLDGESQLGLTSTTDGTLDSQGLVLLDDDLAIQPAQNLVPAVSSKFLADNPEVEDALNSLMDVLDTANLTELNGRVAVDREKEADVAADFLKEQGLI